MVANAREPHGSRHVRAAVRCRLYPPLFLVQQEPENGSYAQRLQHGVWGPRMKKGLMWMTQPLLFLLQLQQLQVVVMMMKKKMLMMMMMMMMMMVQHLYPWRPLLGATRQEGAQSQTVQLSFAPGYQSHSLVLLRAQAARAEAVM